MELQFLVLCLILKLVVAGKVPSYEGRIVGGVVASDGLAPYQCSVLLNGLHECGCSILTQKFVVTAAHCFKSSGSRDITVRVGSNNWKSGGSVYKVHKLIPHENYNETNYSNDICLIRIDAEIKFNPKVQPIKFSKKFIKAGTELQTTGWGRMIGAKGPFPDLLQVLKVRAISNEECKEYGSVESHESHLCTFAYGGEQGGKGICSGDSGGPLISTNGELVGITSWAVMCARGYPDGFTRISFLYDWIQSHVQA